MSKTQFANLTLSNNIGLSLVFHPSLLSYFQNFIKVLGIEPSAQALHKIAGLCPAEAIEPPLQRQIQFCNPDNELPLPLVLLSQCSQLEEPDVYCGKGLLPPYPTTHETCPTKPGMLLQSLYLDVIENGGIPCHSGLAEFRGNGILLSGATGVGKSTSIRRLLKEKPEGFKALSDDLLMLVQTGRGSYATHPFPTWSRCERLLPEECRNVSQATPLRAIYFLQQAEQDEVLQLQRLEATARLNQSASDSYAVPLKRLSKKHQLKLRAKALNNAMEIAASTPCFLLKTSLNGRFWERIEQSISNLS